MVFMQQKTWVVVLKKFIWVGVVCAYVFEKKIIIIHCYL